MLLVPLAVRGEDRRAEGEGIAPIQEAARELAREVEYLQEDIITELAEQKERTLFQQADAVLSAVQQFERSLKPGASPDQMLKDFEAFDPKLLELLKTVQALKPENRLLRRSAARVANADQELHLALFTQEPSESLARKIVEHQSQALVGAARQLDKAAQYAVGAAPARGVLAADLHKAAEAAEQFQKNVASGGDKQQWRKAFAAFNKNWEAAVRGFAELKPEEHVYLLRAADRVDRLHDRLFRLLGMEGERPRLTIRT